MNCYFCKKEMSTVPNNKSLFICHNHFDYVTHVTHSKMKDYESVDFEVTIKDKKYLIFYFFDDNSTEICNMPDYTLIAKFKFLLKLTPENAVKKLKTYLTFS